MVESCRPFWVKWKAFWRRAPLCGLPAPTLWESRCARIPRSSAETFCSPRRRCRGAAGDRCRFPARRRDEPARREAGKRASDSRTSSGAANPALTHWATKPRRTPAWGTAGSHDSRSRVYAASVRIPHSIRRKARWPRSCAMIGFSPETGPMLEVCGGGAGAVHPVGQAIAFGSLSMWR